MTSRRAISLAALCCALSLPVARAADLLAGKDGDRVRAAMDRAGKQMEAKDYDRSYASYGEAIELAHKYKDRDLEGWYRLQRAWMLLKAGRHVDADRDCAVAREIYEPRYRKPAKTSQRRPDGQDRYNYRETLKCLRDGAIEASDTARAKQLIGEELALLLPVKDAKSPWAFDWYYEAESTAALGRVAGLEGDHEAAAQHYDKAKALYEREVERVKKSGYPAESQLADVRKAAEAAARERKLAAGAVQGP